MLIDIIGAGIGGLTTAIALEKKGFKTRIFEQTKKIQPVGAGIILANNAMQVYEKLGLREIIEKNGNHISSLNITDENLNPLSKIDLSSFEKKHKVKNIAIHRGILQQILIDKLHSSSLKLNHKLKEISKNKEGYTLAFENGEYINTTILIGADGIHSTIRQNLFEQNIIRKANQICWRGVSEFKFPEKYTKELNEAWGKTERFGFVQIAKNTAYWYALKSFKKNKEEYQLENIDSYFNQYNQVVKDIISSTKRSEIHTAEIYDLKPINTWHIGNVCIIGDAAHPMTPNMGQGACQAIEDAYILSECLYKYDVNIAFQKFQNLRLSKAHQIVNTSWRIGKLAHINNPFLIAIRNFILKKTPSSVNKKQLHQIFNLVKI